MGHVAERLKAVYAGLVPGHRRASLASVPEPPPEASCQE